VRASCHADGLHVDLFRGAERIRDEDRLLAVTIGGPTLSGSLASSLPAAGVGPSGNAPVAREAVEDWIRLGHKPGHEVRTRLADDARVVNCTAR
jgi:hypothetical protein